MSLQPQFFFLREYSYLACLLVSVRLSVKFQYRVVLKQATHLVFETVFHIYCNALVGVAVYLLGCFFVCSFNWLVVCVVSWLVFLLLF